MTDKQFSARSAADTKEKIVFFISSFRAGGGEKQMIEIANAFAAHDYAVDLLVLKPVGEYQTLVDSRVSVISFDAGRMLFSFPQFIAYLRRAKPDTLFALDEYTHLLSLGARRARVWFPGGRASHTRIVLRVGNMYSELFRRYRGIKNALMKVLIRHCYRYADGILANSRGVADDIEKIARIPEERISVIYNPKDTAMIHARMREPVDHEWFTRKTAPIVIAAGRLREQKNFGILIRAFARVSEHIPARLVIVGAGREEGHLRALIREQRCEDRAALLGHVSNPYAYFAKADVFVSTSLWEGFPNALQEALICSLPCIASDCSSGPREILAPESDYRLRLTEGVEYARWGVLTAVGDEDALVSALERVLSDKELRMQYAQYAWERGADFDLTKVWDVYERMLIS